VGAPKWWAGELDQVHRLTPYGLRDITEPTAFARRYFRPARPRRTRSPGAAVPGAERPPRGSAARLLCFEEVTQPGAWCHRRLMATWIEHCMGVEVPELSRQPSLLDA